MIDNKVYHLLVKNYKGRGERAYGERGGVGVNKKQKTRSKITQNRKTAIDFDQNRKPHTKPSKPKIYTAQFSPNPSLDLKRW